MRHRIMDVRRQTRRGFSRIQLLVVVALIALAIVAVLRHQRQSVHISVKLQHDTVRKEDKAGDEMSLSDDEDDPLTSRLEDQITLAKGYLVIAKENNNLELAWELSTQIRAWQLLLSRSATQGGSVAVDKARQEQMEVIGKELSLLIHKARELHYDSAGLMMRLKARIESLEERASVAAAQSASFGQLAAEAIPKGLYCFGSQLTAKWASDPNLRNLANIRRQSPKLTDKKLFHFCIFSDNVLAASVAVNSTVQSSAHPDRLVFHLVTNRINFGAMQAWFTMNNFRGSSIEVQNVDALTWLNASYVPVLRQLQDAATQKYYFKGEGAEEDASTAKFRNPKYLSILNHLRFYLPELYPSLDKIVFLDDDIVVQKDLSPLFSIDLHGNVIGAVETCLGSFHRYHKYLNFSHPKIHTNFDPEACGWAFGMNVFDLVMWKKENITSRYHYWQEQNADRTVWKLGTLPPGLLTFYGLTQPLDPQWHVLGLGYDPNVDTRLIKAGAVVHFNGNMKPWLKLAMTGYKPIWDRHVNYSHPLIQQCNLQ